ncbi:copper-binding protein [Zeimonas arvi]|uniref:Copper-binding protein n=1 Tax=Zeimonas arvi TaxID=2498847 RepID=A0A5C8P636_9BURK|nr:copper-binding protein [Zeimonas arvi]TXL68773.1 copper-binding protein [Zeimonas arvi]
MSRLASRAARVVAAASRAALPTPAATFTALALSVAVLASAARAAPPAAPAPSASPLDPAAPATALPQRQGLAGGYRPLPALEPLPWRRLFDDSGDFVDHDRPAGAPQAGREPGPQAERPPLAQAAPAAHGHGGADASSGASAPAGADAVATVLRIDREAQRVRLRHGPIAKLEMPGMTMLFQVADPALLDAVSVGETIGFRVEQRGQAFVIIDWVREGAK